MLLQGVVIDPNNPLGQTVATSQAQDISNTNIDPFLGQGNAEQHARQNSADSGLGKCHTTKTSYWFCWITYIFIGFKGTVDLWSYINAYLHTLQIQ